MKGVLALLSTLLISLRLQYVAADCNSYKPYNTTFIPACDPKDQRVMWPDYENQRTYYQCFGVNNPVLMTCQYNQYFCFALQTCGSCAQYIPPVECSKLPTENKAKCESTSNPTPTPAPGDSTSPSASVTTGFPTPNYPSTVTSTTKTTTKTTAGTPTTTSSTTTTTTTPGPGTNPTPPTSSDPTGIPPIDYPSTVDPNVPSPPTPPGTPPNVSVEPPTVPPVPVS